MLPWAIRRRSASGVMSTSSIWSARADDLVGHRLALRDAGDPLDHVVERLEVLDVDRRDHVDPGVEQLVDVLPALLVARPGHVGVRELVDQRDLGRRARTASRSISSNVGAAVGRPSRGARPRGRRPARRSWLAAVGLDEADDDVGAALARGAGPRRASRRSCRPRARRRGRCAAEPRRHRRSSRLPVTAPSAASSARLSSQHVDAAARRGSRASGPSVCSSTSARTSATVEARARRRPAAPGARRTPSEMCGSSPEPEAVTASTGTGAPASSAVRRRGRRPRAPRRRRAGRGSSGPRFEPPSWRSGVVAVAGGRRPGLEVLAARSNVLADQRGADDARRRARRASRWPCRGRRPGRRR